MSNNQNDKRNNDHTHNTETVRYPDINRANNTKILVWGSLAAILLIFILSLLFPSRPADSDETTDTETTEEITTEAATEKPIISGWQTVDDAIRYVRKDGKIAKNQWIGEYYVGASGTIFTCALTPDGTFVDADGKRDDSMGTQGSHEGLTPLKNTLEDMVSGYSGTWSIYVKDLGHNEYLSINNVQHFSASMIKLYCAAAAYELMENGTLEETENVDRLMSEMISVSDNDAFNLMVMNCSENHNHVEGRGVIQDYIDREGYTDTTITSMLVPTKYPAPSSPGRNYTTVNDCGLLMERIYKEKLVSKEASRDFLDLLLKQNHINKIPSGLPEGTKCANKTGDTDEVQHDAAIVYSPGGDYIIAVMSTNCGAAIPNIQNISKVVYEYFN